MESALSKEKMTLEKAKYGDIEEIAELIYITEPEPEEEWGYGTKEEMKETLKRLMKIKDNRFSISNILVARQNHHLIGMALILEGKDIGRLTINSDKYLIEKQKGFLNKLGIIYSSIKNYFLEEAKKDELYISNIAIKPEYRGNGYADDMIQKIDKKARRKGYRKLSLIAKNDKLITFYERIGFTVENRKIRRMVMAI